VSVPCRPHPDDAVIKTIGLAPCPDCGSLYCWTHYLAWEKHAGVTLNEAAHPAVDDWADRVRRMK
jgi:hypothetical protein